MKSLARLPGAVWAVTGLWGALLVFYTILFPTYRGPDENRHVDLIVAVRRDSGYPNFDQRNLSQAMVRSMEAVHFEKRSFNLTEKEAPPRRARPRLAGPEADIPSESVNQIPQHPPLYYALMAGVSSFADTFIPGADRWPFDKYVWFLRLLNILLVLPLPALAYLAAREVGIPERPALGAAIFPLAVPQLTHIGATVNNDNLLTLLIGVLTLMMLRIGMGDASRRLAVWSGVLGGLALLTKGFALFLPVWFLLTYLVGGKGQRRQAWSSAGVAFAIMLFIGGWWWVVNVISFGTVQPGVPLLPPAPAGFNPDYVFWATRFLAWMPIRFWGWFGWFDVRLPLAVPVVATSIVLTTIGIALATRRAPRLLSMVLLTPAAAIAGIAAFAALRGYLRTANTPAIQGRYLFPGVVGLAVVVVAGTTLFVRSRERSLLATFILAAGVMQGVAVTTILPAYWGPAGSSLMQRLAALGAWLPWSPVWMSVLLPVAVLWWMLPIRGRVHDVESSNVAR